MDVSVVSSLQQQLIRRSSEAIGSAAEKRHQEKLSKYSGACNSEGIDFFPMVVETFGGWIAVEVILKLARQLASHTGGDSEEVRNPPG